VCSCHTYCQGCCLFKDRLRPLPKKIGDIPPAGLTFHPFKVVEGSDVELVIAPYVNVSVTDDEADLIMSDVRRKLNGHDPNNGLGVLHGSLVHSDNVDLFAKLLELGLDTELRFVHVPGANVKEGENEILKDLNGGTALHFAARFGRARCFRALVDAGADVEAKTAAGTAINELETTCVLNEVVVSCLLTF
jgi:hypothetical protein